MPQPNQPSHAISRENAGVLVAAIVVMAFVGIGFLQMLSEAIFGVPMTAPGDWMAAMLSLASAALGYLIGKQTTQNGANPGQSAVTIETPVANVVPDPTATEGRR